MNAPAAIDVMLPFYDDVDELKLAVTSVHDQTISGW